jgi:hypothetical protein
MLPGMSEAPGRLPTFLIIGTQKSATRWLRYNLGRHPEVFTPKVSEVSFFDVNYDKGLDWYRSHFVDAADATAVGESTPGYTMWTRRPERCAKRIAADLPDARLLAILRNPIDRCYSAFIHHQRMGRIPPEADLLEHVRTVDPETDGFGLVSGGWYARSLAPYVERFAADQLLVVLNDDVKNDEQATFAAAAKHIGVDPGFTPPKLDAVRFSNAPAPGSRYAKPDAPDERRALTPHERQELLAVFEPEIADLEQLLGRDLTFWRG